MESLQDIVVEGVTAFVEPPAKNYRYVIELKSSKMSIWIEDRTSKKQWFKGGMVKTDYVSSANAIADASERDYVKCFQDMLDCKLDDSNDVHRKLFPIQGGGVRLELGVAVRVLRATRLVTYTFDLDPVSVERLDILESKLRDQQEEVEKLRGEVQDCGAPLFVKLTASKKSGSSIVWDAIESDLLISTGLDGKIKMLRGGVYSIAVVVNAVPNDYNYKVELLKNAASMQAANTGYSQGYGCSTTLYTIEHLQTNDELTTACAGNLHSVSYLSIVRLDK
ncbi:unnamed protein product [Peronospora belbahrii]|uniref:Uncharacterized protein n=1 Tax=Peronospora belbahrii TaxID=622444 RepID=A0ABN8D802_9STRA|nr:unnamed protein product [Peronospora belbahrii]